MRVSVKSHPTSGASVPCEKTATYSVGNKGQKIVAFSLKMFHYRDRVLPPLIAIHTEHACPLLICELGSGSARLP